MTPTCGWCWPSPAARVLATWSATSYPTRWRWCSTTRTGPGPVGAAAIRPRRAGRSPTELFGDYLTEQNIDDPRLNKLFAELLEIQVTARGG